MQANAVGCVVLKFMSVQSLNTARLRARFSKCWAGHVRPLRRYHIAGARHALNSAAPAWQGISCTLPAGAVPHAYVVMDIWRRAGLSGRLDLGHMNRIATGVNRSRDLHGLSVKLLSRGLVVELIQRPRRVH